MAKALLDADNSNKNSVAPMQPILTTEDMVSLPIEELMARLKATAQGLTSEQAAERLEVYGKNEFAHEHKHSALKEFLSHFKSPLVIILLIAGIITGTLGEVANTANNFNHNFCQRSFRLLSRSLKLRKPLELLKEKVTTTATVLRDGVKQEIKLTRNRSRRHNLSFSRRHYSRRRTSNQRQRPLR